MGISVGIIGIGSFGQEFIRLFRDHPLVDRIALCDVRTERLSFASRQFQITETYKTFEEICQSNLHAVVLFTQPWLHGPQAVKAMESGKHVYSAVPVMLLSNDDEMLDWCDKIIKTCQRTGMQYMMGETSFYRPQAMYCRRRADEGAFGRFVLAEGEYFHDLDDLEYSLREIEKRRWTQWDNSRSGEAPMRYPTHSIGGLMSTMPGVRMTEVSAFGYVHPNDDWFRKDTVSGNLFSNETALFRLSNGAVARICEYRRIGHPAREAFQLFGTDGSFSDGPGGCFWVTKTGYEPLSIEQMRDALPPEVLQAWRRNVAEDADVYGGHGGSHAYLAHEFVESVADGRMSAINAWVAMRFFVPGVIAHKSALKDGELLKIPDWGDPPV